MISGNIYTKPDSSEEPMCKCSNVQARAEVWKNTALHWSLVKQSEKFIRQPIGGFQYDVIVYILPH